MDMQSRETRHKQLIAGGILLIIALSMQTRSRVNFNGDDFAALSRGSSQQNKEIKQANKTQKDASHNETKKKTHEIRRIFEKASKKRSEARYHECARIAHEGRKKYPLNIYLYNTEFNCTRDSGRNPKDIFYEYVGRLDRKSSAYHEAWAGYHNHNKDYALAIESLQKSVELEADNLYRLQLIGNLVWSQHHIGRHQDAIDSAARFFDLNSGTEAHSNLDGLVSALSGNSKRLSGKYSVAEWCKDIQRAHNIGWKMDIDNRNPDPEKCPIK